MTFAPSWETTITFQSRQVSEPPAVAGGQSHDKNPTRGEGSATRDITRTIHGETYRLNAESFFQANDGLLTQVIDAALANATGESAVELYCGVGLFTLPLARRFKHVVGVEGDGAASAFARDSLRAAALSNAEIANQDVARWLEDTIQSADKVAALQNPDFLLLDPPRTGAESRVIAGILKLQPQRISYVSCDPATLARDLKKLLAGGYQLLYLSAFDMFPQTHHIETVAHLARVSARMANY